MSASGVILLLRNSLYQSATNTAKAEAVAVSFLIRIAFPILALLVGALVWALTGWALRPVEAIRAEVAELSATDLRRRVPITHIAGCIISAGSGIIRGAR